MHRQPKELAGDAGQVEVADGVRAVAGQVEESGTAVFQGDKRGHNVFADAKTGEVHVTIVGQFGGVHNQRGPLVDGHGRKRGGRVNLVGVLCRVALRGDGVVQVVADGGFGRLRVGVAQCGQCRVEHRRGGTLDYLTAQGGVAAVGVD